ncbi:TetR/AcrR family transcriptional regulator [Rhodococcus oryzae]|uniref:TetR/AcrR family transcriptional regulator n=1 Tax=Rhodococcus oryzae TaxID=2571143 RepID=UPI003794D3A1
MTSADQEAVNPIATAAVDRLFDRQRDEYLTEAQRLIRACSSLIAETGQVDPPVAAILERAGLATRAFYRLFNSKEELIIAVLQDGTTTKTSYVIERMSSASTPRERIDAWVRAVVVPYTQDVLQGYRAILLHTYRWETMFPTELAAMREQLLQPLVHAIADLRGDDDPKNAHTAAEIIYDAFFGAACRAEAQRRLVAPDEVTALTRMAALIATSFSATE